MRRLALAAAAAFSLLPCAVSLNVLCWHGFPENEVIECCEGTPEQQRMCWNAPSIWRSQEFCCHPLSDVQQTCFGKIYKRIVDKLARLEEIKNAIGNVEPKITFFLETYKMYLKWPEGILAWACRAITSPALWSDKCECCEPESATCTREQQNTHEYSRCCNPVYSSRVEQEHLDPNLEEAIGAQFSGAPFDRQIVRSAGAELRFRFDSIHGVQYRACLFWVRNSQIFHCSFEDVCGEVHDCSYAKAFKMTLDVINDIKSLPDLDLVLNPTDVTLDGDHPRIPVFTRGASWFSNTIALPHEWQLNPSQCRKTVNLANGVIAWDDRIPKLFWRGGNSNCRAVHCNLKQASEFGPDFAEMRNCSRLYAGNDWTCKWDVDNWFDYQRGRLVWMTQFFSNIDAKFAGRMMNGHCDDETCLTPQLRELLLEEGLIGKTVSAEEQHGYKYKIVPDGTAGADRLFSDLFSGSVVLVPNGPWRHMPIGEMLRPFVHFVPVRFDLADLPVKLAWLQANDEEARDIATRAAEFARKYLTCDAIVYLMDRLIRRYAEASK